jgi:hypothetical protein
MDQVAEIQGGHPLDIPRSKGVLPLWTPQNGEREDFLHRLFTPNIESLNKKFASEYPLLSRESKRGYAPLYFLFPLPLLKEGGQGDGFLGGYRGWSLRQQTGNKALPCNLHPENG